MLVKDFDYELPEKYIAQFPVETRDNSKLMLVNRTTKSIVHKHFFNLPDYLEEGDTLVFNNTRVIPARLFGTKKDTGAKIEVFLLTRTNNDEWEVLVRPGKKAKPGTIIEFNNCLSCEVLQSTDFGGRIVKFSYEGNFEEILNSIGETPLPPYIKEKLANSERYQTVYSKEWGSAAAPTAGLHFTSELLEKIKAKGVNLAYVTLHVGLGTFRPVSVENIAEHNMHKEFYSIPEDTANIIRRTKEKNKRVIAVGTTSVRALESCINQEQEIKPCSNWTNIFIYPGYKFKVIDALITNFHLPQSTLLMLVSAMASRELIMEAYEEAKKTDYRFFSFGDAMFII